MMTRDEFFRALLQAARDAGAEEAEAFFLQSESMRALARQGEIDDYSVNQSGGLSLRVLKDGKVGSAFTEALDEQAIPMLVQNALKSAALIDDADEQFFFAGSPEYADVSCQGDAGTPQQRIAMALALDRDARKIDPLVTELGLYTGVETGRGTLRLTNTLGLDLSHTWDECACFVSTIARRDARTTSGFAMDWGQRLCALDPEKTCREAVESAVFLLDAKPCKSGTMPVIFRNDCMPSLLGAFCGIFSAEAAQKGLSLLNGREGEKIAADCITLVDDPLLAGGAATRPFDLEGVATSRKEIISAGKLATLLHNLKTAKKAGCKTTGNASRGGYASSVGVSPSNLYLCPGTKSLQALCAQMGSGLVVTGLSGLHAGADPISGDFSLLCEGYLVENGQKSRPIDQVTVAGNFYRLLQDAVAVGDDLKFPSGALGSPSVLVGALTVAGQ